MTSAEERQRQKSDAGKADWLLFPWKAAKAILRVLEYGARRYSRGGWRTVEDAKERYANAAMRHLIAYMDGKYWDLCDAHPTPAERPDDCKQCSGEPHLAHLGCDCLFLLELDERPRGKAKPAPSQWRCPGYACGAERPVEGWLLGSKLRSAVCCRKCYEAHSQLLAKWEEQWRMAGCP